MLESGKYADFVVLEKDLLTCPIDDVKDMKVLMTVVDGKTVYESEDEAERIKPAPT
jgi:predicted amidohydrolase YtcJ